MTTIAQSAKQVSIQVPQVTIGLDLGDRWSEVHVVDASGQGKRLQRVRTTAAAMREAFKGYAGARIALEVGTHSPWLSRLLRKLGLEVIVANPSKTRLIAENQTKNDKVDAELLARVARLDPRLLCPVEHRGPQAQADLALLRSRDALVRIRSTLINHVRGTVKSMGERLPACSAEAFANKAADRIPEPLADALQPVIAQIAAITARIKAYDRKIEQLCVERYPETAALRQVRGVGPLSALAFVLVLECPQRFAKSRAVGPYLGLVSRQRQSSDNRPQLSITKAGNELLRRYLVNAAHYILGPFGTDCDLRRYGEAICARGGKNAKRRAIVAVARKLAVLLHRLWISGQAYEPLRQAA